MQIGLDYTNIPYTVVDNIDVELNKGGYSRLLVSRVSLHPHATNTYIVVAENTKTCVPNRYLATMYDNERGLLSGTMLNLTYPQAIITFAKRLE